MLSTGRLARKVNVSTDCVRFYERVGLLTPSSKTDAGYRLYGEDCVRRLRFIRHAQRCGFSLPQIRELLDVDSAPDPRSRCGLALEKKQEIEETMEALRAMKDVLSSYIDSCERYARSADVHTRREGSLVSALAAELATV